MAKVLQWGQSKQAYPMADKYVNLKKDETALFRVYSATAKFGAHWMDDLTQPTATGYKKRKFICPEVNCPICKRGELPRTVYSAVVLWDPTGTGKTPLENRLVRVLEFPRTVYKEIEKYAVDEDYGYPDSYDIKVLKTGSGFNTEYSTTARPVNKCEQLDDDLVQKIDSEIAGWEIPTLEELYKPSTIEKIQEFLATQQTATGNSVLDAEDEDDSEEEVEIPVKKTVAAVVPAPKPKAKAQPKVVEELDSDEDDDIPPFDMSEDELTVENLFD